MTALRKMTKEELAALTDAEFARLLKAEFGEQADRFITIHTAHTPVPPPPDDAVERAREEEGARRWSH